MVGLSLICLLLFLVFRWSMRTVEAERSARRATEAQMAAKSAFIAMVSHELRTPINAILNGASTLELGASGDRSAAKLFGDAGVMMRAMLNDLLDLSKIEAGRMSVEMVDHDLRALVSDTVLFWQGESQAKGIPLRLEGGDDLPDWVRGDPMRVRQGLNNLLSNALKFTAQGEVVVSAWIGEKAGERKVCIAVRDTGPGIAGDQIGNLFSPYEQLGAQTARNFGGTGLGLSISRDLARLMGGELTVASAEGGGACFTLCVLAPQGNAPVTPGPEDVEDLSRRDEAPLVLVVDDHDINRRTLRQMLEAFGVLVETADDGLAALAMAEQRAFSAILMDVHMPGMDGLEAARRLREFGVNRETPIVAVTGGVSPEEVAACREAGMTGWVEKPVNPRDLYVALFG